MNPHEISDEDYLEAIAETLTEWNSEAGDRAYLKSLSCAPDDTPKSQSSLVR